MQNNKQPTPAAEPAHIAEMRIRPPGGNLLSEKPEFSKIAYYSDFDINYVSWKSEYECITIFGSMLQGLLRNFAHRTP